MAHTTSTATSTILPPNKKWYQKKWTYIVVAIIFFVGISVFAQSRGNQTGPHYDTVRVEKGSLTQTVDATGNIQSADELDLRFESAGRIAKVYVTTNQEVKAGTILADLDLRELNARIGQASAGVGQSQAMLEQIKVSANDAIVNAEAALQKAELNLKLSQGGADSEIIRDAYTDAVGLLIQIQASVAHALTQVDNILGIDNTFANDVFENELSIHNIGLLSTAESQYVAAKADMRTFDERINLLSLQSSHIDIDTALSFAERVLASSRTLLYTVGEVLNASPVVGDLTQTMLDGFKSSISGERISLSTKFSSLITQQQAIQSAKNSYTTNKVLYEQAEQNLRNAREKAAADIAAYEASIRESQASVGAAVATRNRSRIVAPISGTVAKIAFKAGEFVSSQDAVVKLVSPRFEVKVDIPETDIVKIATGVSTTVTLDAYGSEVKFNGIVTEIETGETVIQDVVYYTVTVVLEEKSGYEILNGMTADVIFYTEKKEHVLYIPQRAIRTEDDRKLVRVLQNGEVRDVIVETGLRGDGGIIEIISGLEEGQEVVVRERTE